jgi:hypothetical protein
VLGGQKGRSESNTPPYDTERGKTRLPQDDVLPSKPKVRSQETGIYIFDDNIGS